MSEDCHDSNNYSLFPNGEPLARNADPDTSHVAAAKLTRSGRRDSDKLRVYQWMQQNTGSAGITRLVDVDLTSHEASHYSGISHPTMHKRLPDLRRDGYVVNVRKRICRITGEYCLTWRVNDRTQEE